MLPTEACIQACCICSPDLGAGGLGVARAEALALALALALELELSADAEDDALEVDAGVEGADGVAGVLLMVTGVLLIETAQADQSAGAHR